MTHLSTLTGIDLPQLEEHLKALVMEFLGLLRRNKKNLPEDFVTRIKHEEHGVSYDKELDVEWSHLTLAAHKRILEFQTPNQLLAFVRSNPSLKGVLLDVLPEPPRPRGLPPIERERPSEDEIENGNLHTRIVDPFLSHYISEAKSLSFKENAFKKTFNVLKKALVSSKDEGIIICPITNLVIKNQIQLDDGIVIRNIREKEMEEWLSASGWVHPPMTFYELTRLKCLIQMPFVKDRDYTAAFGGYIFTSTDFNDQRLRIKKILTALQLTFDAKVQPAFLSVEITNGFFERGLFFEWEDIYHHDCKLNKDNLRSFRKISKNLKGKELIVNLELAIKKWDESKDRHNAEDALLDYWTALETLFIRDKNPEKQYRVVSRIVSFLGEKKSERAVLFDLLKDSYNYRSCIVHGSPKELQKIRRDRKKQGQMFMWTRIYLKKAILKFLKEGDIDIEALKIERRLAERGIGKLN